MSRNHPEARRVLAFWFEEHGNEDWFGGKAAFDEAVRSRFEDTLAQGQRGELSDWRITPEGRVAEIIVLDQFSRQLHRGCAQAFASDGMALVLAQELVLGGLDRMLSPDQRQFAWMPFMHAESLAMQDWCVRLFLTREGENPAAFAEAHRDTIRRFGRFPMRNAALGRTNSPEEQVYIEARDGRMF